MRLHAGRLAIIRAVEQQGNDKLQILQKEADTYATQYKIANLQLVHSQSPAMLTQLYAHLQNREQKFQVLQDRVDTINFLIATYRHDAPERGLHNLHNELFSIRKEMQSRSRALAHYKANISRVEGRAEFVQQEMNRFMPRYNDYLSQIASEKKVLERKLQRL
jgi:chromosome segregation ATPase